MSSLQNELVLLMISSHLFQMFSHQPKNCGVLVEENKILRACTTTVLTEDLGSAISAHVRWLITACNAHAHTTPPNTIKNTNARFYKEAQSSIPSCL